MGTPRLPYCSRFLPMVPKGGTMGQQMDFLPTPPPRGAWVFRWQVSPPPLPPLPHLQICQRPLTIETENPVGGGAWGLSL